MGDNMSSQEHGDGFASADAGKTILGTWQGDPGGMEIRPVPPAATNAQQQMVQGQQWSQATPMPQPTATMQPTIRQMPSSYPQQGWSRGNSAQAGANPMPYGQTMPQMPAQASYQQGGYIPQEQRIPMQGASVPQFAPQRKKSRLPLFIGMIVLVALAIAGVALLSRPEEPPIDRPDTPSVVPTGNPNGDDETPIQDPIRDGGVTDDGNAPTADDFQWAGAEWIKEGHVPERATRLADLETVLGDWKGYIRYEPATADDELVEEFLNVTVGGDRTSATFRFDWGYAIVRNGASRYDDATEDSEFLGTWDSEAGAIYATCDSGNLEMKRFWDEDGRQYAYGSITLPDGAVGDVYLTRS